MAATARSRDVGVGVVSALLGAGFTLSALQITPDPSAFNVLGPRVAPLTIGIVWVFVSLVLVVQSLRSAPRPEASSTPPDGAPPESDDTPSMEALIEAADPGTNRSVVRLVITFALLVGYVLVFIPLGYIVSTALFLFVLSTYTDRRKWLRNAVFAMLFAVVVFYVFTEILHVQLPAGILE